MTAVPGLVAVLLGFLAVQGGAATAPFPAPEEFARKVRQALQLDADLQKDFVYLERRRDVRISMLGKVSIGPLRTFEVYPSDQPGGTYKRLIEIDGKPLPPAELARRDAEHERDLRTEAERARRETGAQRAERQRKADEERRERNAILDDAVAVFEPTFAGRDRLDGRSVLVVDLNPRARARPGTREGRWMKQFRGRIWVDEAEYQIVRLDMHAFEDVTIGWGIIGRVHKDSRAVFSRRRFENVWLPAESTYEASGRTLLFRPFKFSVTATYSNYRRRMTNP